jgi:hypothetical protein
MMRAMALVQCGSESCILGRGRTAHYGLPWPTVSCMFIQWRMAVNAPRLMPRACVYPSRDDARGRLTAAHSFLLMLSAAL